MSDSLIPREQPYREAEAEGHKSADKGRTGRRRGSMFTADDCLARLAALSGLVAAKILTPAEANAIRSCLTAILAHLRDSQAKPTSARLSDSDLASLRRTNPAAFSLLEPLLTDEQLAQILHDTDEDCDVET